jgi:hypothetical protein
MDPDLVLRLVNAQHHRRQPIRRTRGALNTIARVRARRHRGEVASS